MSAPVPVFCLYRVKAEGLESFRALLGRHWPALHALGLTTDEPAEHWLSREKGGGDPVVVERFAWKDAEMPGRAHELPDVMAIWEPMGALCEERDGQRSMEFLHVEPLDVPRA